MIIVTARACVVYEIGNVLRPADTQDVYVGGQNLEIHPYMNRIGLSWLGGAYKRIDQALTKYSSSIRVV